MARRRQINQSYFKSIIFGFEDGLVSTTGMVAGLAAGSQNAKIVILGGLVNIASEGLSMGAGEFISERGIHAMRGNRHTDNAALSGVIMSLSFAVAGFIPLLPVMTMSFPKSLYTSLGAALLALFLLGVVKTRAIRAKGPLRSAIETLVIGGGAALIGFLVGVFLKI
jgi:VIT1/CCC1 family predicted Fe2+/Mn2+ transporter